MAKAEVNIPIVGDSTKYKKALEEAGGATDKFAGNLKKLAQGAAVAFAADAVIDFASASVKAAAEDEKAQKTLAEQIKRTTGATDDQIASVEEFINKTQNATGVLDDELRPAFGNLIRATKDTSQAQDLLSLTMDISAATGRDVEAVSLAVSKAYNGNVGGLQKLGISMKGANGETLSFAEAQKQLTEQFGGAAAAAADTAEGKYKIMQARFSDLQEEIGAKLLPVLAGLADFMVTTLIPAVEQVVAWVETNWPKIKQPFIDVSEFVQALWGTFGQTLVDFTQRYFGGVKDAIVGVFQIIQGVFQLFHDILTGKWGELWGDIVKIVTGIKGVIVGALEGLWAEVLLVAHVAWDALGTIITGAWDKIITFITGLPSRIASASAGMFDGIKNAFKSAINWIIRGWNGLQFSMPSFDTHIPGVGTVGGFTVGVPDIPQLAQGGIVQARRGGTLALLGEGGRDEAVIPLGAGGGMGSTIYATINMPVGSNGDDVVKAIRKFEARNGPGWRS